MSDVQTALQLAPLYRSAASGDVLGYLRGHPELLSPSVVMRIEHDAAQALEAADLRQARTRLRAGAAVQESLGEHVGAVAFSVDELQVRQRITSRPRQLERLRSDALEVGARAHGLGAHAALVLSWLIAVEVGLDLALRKPGRPELFLEPGSDLADLLEFVAAETSLDLVPSVAARAAVDLLRYIDVVESTGWPPPSRLRAVALATRLARASERLLARDRTTAFLATAEQNGGDAARVLGFVERYS